MQKFWERMIDILMEDANTMIIMNDKEHFHLGGYVTNNYWYWAAENSWELHQRLIHGTKVTVMQWPLSRLLCSYFFKKVVNVIALIPATVPHWQFCAFRTLKMSSKNERDVVPTRWCHTPHCKGLIGCSTNVSCHAISSHLIYWFVISVKIP